MKFPVLAFAMAVAFTLSAPALAQTDAGEAQRTPIIPRPVRVDARAGRFHWDAATRIVAHGAAARRAGADLAARIARDRGFDPVVARHGRGRVIDLRIDDAAPAGEEAYALDVDAEGVRIRARSEAGLFYGAISLWQLATADGGRGAVEVAAQHIEDAPRFAWRGLMLDVARHFRSVDEVKALIDQMAQHKLNTLHWHLTDDQGWRIQIRRYPRLTDVGGCRIPAGAAGRNDDGTPRPYCGFYTQEQIRDVVAYAAARHVAVVPEIDLPGHAQAAIAAYPQLGVTGQAPPVSPDWGVHTWLFNVDDGTFAFLENVLAEVVELFPSRYVHLGGDEAAKDQWQQSTAVQARRAALGLKDDMQLQSWFMGRLGRYLQQHDRRLIGWDEILEGGPPADATVMSWRGTQGAIDAARAGHDVVLSPAPDLYFDHLQSDAGDEIPGRLAVMDLQHVYGFETAPQELTPAQQAHVLGAQANLWTEHLRTNERVQRAAFPRAAALAEALWTPMARRDWPDFQQRLVPMLARYRDQHFQASDSAFAVRFAASADVAGMARVSLSNQTGLGTVHYTLDGSVPAPDSPAYLQPLELPVQGQRLTATAFVGTRALAAPRSFVLDAHGLTARGSQALQSCAPSGLPLRLEDDAPREGARAVVDVDIFDPCWRYSQAELAGVTRVSMRVGQLPYNFQLWHDTARIVTRPAALPGGALEVRLDRCDGAPLLTVPLTAARASDGLTTLEARLPPQTGRHDLCFVFATGNHDPMWVLDEVALLP